MSARQVGLLAATSAALLLMAACTGAAPTASPTQTTEATAAPATPGPTAVTTQLPTSSAPPGLTPSPSPGVSPAAPVWTLVGISDSLIGSAPGDSGYEYARMIEADLGVTVKVVWYFYGGSSSASVLDKVRNHSGLRNSLAMADVIVFNVPTGALKELCPFDNANYGPAPGTPEEYRACGAEMVAGYAADSEAIMAEIDGLRRPDALVRAMNTWVLFHGLFQEMGLGDVVLENFRSINDALQTAADAHGIPVADAFGAFMGADGTGDPVAAGFVGDDQLHPTAEGHTRVAELWRAIGYDPAPSPPQPTPRVAEWPFTATFCGAAPGDVQSVVALGTSESAGWGIREDEPYSPQEAYPAIYAQMLCDEIGVPVELRSYFPSQLGNELAPVAWWVEKLSGDGALRGDLEHADVVLIWPLSSHDVVMAQFLGGACRGGWPDPLRTCLQDRLGPVPALMDEAFGIIDDLVAPEALVLASSGYAPPVVFDMGWTRESYGDDVRAMVDPYFVVEPAAGEHGFVFVDTETPINGNGADWGPPADGLFQSDGLHPTVEGARRTAETFAEADGLGE